MFLFGRNEAKMEALLEGLNALNQGDLSVQLDTSGNDIHAQLANSYNQTVATLKNMAGEVTRLSLEVATEGKLGGKTNTGDLKGTWSELTDGVNLMTSNLTDQVRNISEVATAVAKGDLSTTITIEAKGEIAQLKETINQMVESLRSFNSEVTRMAREVGTDGILGGKAEVPNVSGVWKELTDNVNQMASNLTMQVRGVIDVVTAVARGDFSKKLTVEAKGEIASLAVTINTMVDTLNLFADQVTEVAKSVGVEGQLGGQAEVPDAAGSWKELTDNVNQMATNLTNQVRNIAEVAVAVAKGDFSKKMTAAAKGEVLQLGETINSMTETLNTFSEQVTMVSRTVGVEGKLGVQAEVPDAEGDWRELTDNVNLMASNLTEQVRNIAEVATAVAKGDLSTTITIDAKGEIAQLKETINQMVDNLRTFNTEVTRVAREVGTEGILGGKAEVLNVSGVWKELTDNVNQMAANLTTQVRGIVEVVTGVAQGDFTKKLTVETKGEIASLADTINSMVNTLNRFADQVTAVATTVGLEGKLGAQAEVPEAQGAWRTLTDNVNLMAANLTDQVRNIAEVATAVSEGDLRKLITIDAKGEIATLKETINQMVANLQTFNSEVTRVAWEVGSEGVLGGQARVPNVSGVWKELTDNVNQMASNLTEQVRNIAEVATNVANGNLDTAITIDAKGEIATLKTTINQMVNNLSVFNKEVTRVAREVGSEGILGGQATVPNVSGVWKDLTDNVNTMASNLTNQVRGIIKVITAVARGNLTQKLTIEAGGEIAQLTETINTMIQTLGIFSEEVTRVAREVGTEGKLGGEAKVAQAEGTWGDLTDNVNLLMNNLTNQVRAIARVAQAVTQGDFSQTIDIDVQGEILDLTKNVNQMTQTLELTTEENRQQDWLKTNLAEFFSLMQGQKDLKELAQMLISRLPNVVNAHHGVFYLMDLGTESEPQDSTLRLFATFGYKTRKNLSNRFRIGEGLVGQSAFEKQTIHLMNVPSDYIKISSGLGEASPMNIIVLPILFEESVQAVIELAAFDEFNAIHTTFLEQLADNIGVVINVIQTSTRTEELLRNSQTLAKELQAQQEELKETNERLESQTQSLKESEERLKSQQEELQQTNEELEDKAQLLATQKKEVETKNTEVEEARQQLEEKANQLAITSKYKSEFLANMSHELRTPLNSLLVLAKLLKDNKDKNLNTQQLEFASTIHESGQDLLGLINDILDLSKVEAGKMEVHPEVIDFADIRRYVQQSFTQIAKDKKLQLKIEIPKKLPTLTTDASRLRQILNNLLGNAFKFTTQGKVALTISETKPPQKFDHLYLQEAKSIIAFAVQDTGIGIASDKQQLIFEAFQQADGTTSRRYGGTGLGLSISREVAFLLGGELHLESIAESDQQPGSGGSTFTLFLPQNYKPARTRGLSQASEAEVFSEPRDASTSPPSALVQEKIQDDLHNIQPGDRTLLIVEDDPKFAKTLLALAHEQHFKVIIALDGETGLSLARQLKPDAITLDIQLPLINGWTVLDLLKHDPGTRHIPIHVVSVIEEPQRALEQGAVAYLEKPVSKEQLEETFQKMGEFIDKRVKNLLVVEDDPIQQKHIKELIGNSDVKTTLVGTAKEALDSLKKEKFDCMILDLILPDLSGIQLLENIRQQPMNTALPVIIYTAKDLTEAEEAQLQTLADKIVIKSVKSPERLLSETTLFLHRVESKLPESKQKMIQQSTIVDEELKGRTILIVDDDRRNLFALTSSLETYQMTILHAENGKQGIDTLKQHPQIELILMDIMMPEMDGFEAMQRIRQKKEYQHLPIIALTAKAMKEDREKCLEAGASDYLTKPVDIERLLSLIRVWLYKK